MKPFARTLLALGICILISGQVYAGIPEFPTVVNKEGYEFQLQGRGYKRLIFMKAFEAGFYTISDVSRNEILNDVPKYLEVEYYVAIPGKSLTDYTITHMKRNIASDEFSTLDGEIKLMGQYFVDLKPRDRFSLTYLPGVGTQFAHNGKITGVVPGPKFARALFSVWIGDKPFDPALKRKILP